MPEILKPRWLVPAAVLWAAAAAIAPQAIVERYLPAQYQEYRPSLVQGFWLLKVMLVIDGLLWLALPLVRRLFSADRQPRPVVPVASTARETLAADFWIVVLLTVLAAAMRLNHLSAGLGYDEIFLSTSVYQRNLPGLIARAETHRLFYGLWAWLACQVGGSSEAAVRMPALVFGVASVPAMFLCVRSLVGRREGLVAALLLALSTFHIWYSQEATSYTMAFCFAIASTMSFYRCVSSDARGPWLLWALTAFLATFSHFFVGLMLLFGQALFAGWLLARGAVAAKAAARFVTAAVYALAAFATVTSITLFLYLDALLEANALEARGPIVGNLAFLGQWLAGTYAAWRWQALFGVAAVFGAAILARRDARLALYLSLPSLAVLVLFAGGVMAFITPRYCILALIPATIFVATTVVATVDAVAARISGPARGGVRAAMYAAALAPLIYASGESLSTYFARERYPFRPVADFLAANAAPDEGLIFGGYGYDKFRNYAPLLEPVGDYDGLRRALDSGRPFWLVYYLPSYLADMPTDLRVRFAREGREGALTLHYEGFPDQLITQFEGWVWHVNWRGDERRTAQVGRTE